MKSRRTLLLMMLNISLALLAAVSYLHLDNARSDAERDQLDATAVVADLQDISAARDAVHGGTPSQQISTELQAAAVAAGIAQQLQSVEASSTRDAADSPTLAVRLGAVTLDQLSDFLARLQRSTLLSSESIHLSVPQGPDAVAIQVGESWTAEVVLRATIGDTLR